MLNILKLFGALALSYVNNFTKFFIDFLTISYNLLRTLVKEETLQGKEGFLCQKKY